MLKILLANFLCIMLVNAEIVNGIDEDVYKKGLSAVEKAVRSGYSQKRKELQKKIDKMISKGKEIQNRSGDAVYFFTSGSVPLDSFMDFILEGYVLNGEFSTQVVVVIQGFPSKEYLNKLLKIDKKLKEFERYDSIVENIHYLVDPYIFKKLKIKKAPVIALGHFEKNDIYPSEVEMRYVQRGNKSLIHFYGLLKEKEEGYEEQYNTLVSYF